MFNERLGVPIGQCDREEKRAARHTIATVTDHAKSLSRIPLCCIRATVLIRLVIYNCHMARPIPPNLLSQLVKYATEVFIKQGYQRTQMADIAAALGVTKGTLYLYVEGKDALFDLVLRRADAEYPFAQLPSLPIPTPKPGATLQYVHERLTRNQTLPALAEALSRQRVANPRVELEAIVRELYDSSSDSDRKTTSKQSRISRNDLAIL